MNLTPALINGIADAAIFFAAGMLIESMLALALIGLSELVARASGPRKGGN